MPNTITHQARELALNIQRTNFQLGRISRQELQEFYFKNFISLNNNYYENNNG